MSANVIDNIEIIIPEKTIELDYLLKILAMCNNAKVLGDSSVQATSDQKLKPTITFVAKTAAGPSFSFTGSGLEKECFYVGKLPIGFNPNELGTSSTNSKRPLITIKSDNVGEYLQVKWPFATYNQLSFKQLYARVADKVVSLDHVGILINPRLLPKTRYEKLKRLVAGSSYLYDSPSGKEWPFIIPSSLVEQQQGIKVGIKRDPKFEFAYDFAPFYPEIQLDIQTSLSPKETLALFPPPYGFYDPDPKTGDYCSSVFIYTGWGNVSLRIDLRFYVPDFSHTDWLLSKGSRVRIPNDNLPLVKNKLKDV